ncbi:MAG: DNA repair protein [Candidatus Scalindua rubra]|uniref:DNA repair protein n=1 Tax=Candidatus Scalindua rubra TaxID=1872076 RepID=A0A1E3X943_9BACT|nr:MAG: DNA repair protein [Candidatus Scalindua rubra]
MSEKAKNFKSFTLHDLPKSERPRERLKKLGPDSLSAQELLALILGRGVRGESVSMTAQKLLSHLEITKRLIEAGKILGIEVVDHIVVTKESFFSFKEKGLIKKS